MQTDEEHESESMRMIAEEEEKDLIFRESLEKDGDAFLEAIKNDQQRH